MEADWMADRALLRQLLQKHPHWTNQQYAEVVCRSVAWVTLRRDWGARVVCNRATALRNHGCSVTPTGAVW